MIILIVFLFNLNILRQDSVRKHLMNLDFHKKITKTRVSIVGRLTTSQ